MTDDIVTRLRYKQRLHEGWDAVNGPLFGDAADEIERLREEVAKWRMIADDFATTHRHRLGLDGAWDKCNLAYEKAVRGD